MTNIEVVREALRYLSDFVAAEAALDSLEAELAQAREERDAAVRALRDFWTYIEGAPIKDFVALTEETT